MLVFIHSREMVADWHARREIYPEFHFHGTWMQEEN
jgi:hypothetical protein